MEIVVLDSWLDSLSGWDRVWDVMILCVGAFGGSFAGSLGLMLLGAEVGSGMASGSLRGRVQV